MMAPMIVSQKQPRRLIALASLKCSGSILVAMGMKSTRRIRTSLIHPITRLTMDWRSSYIIGTLRTRPSWQANILTDKAIQTWSAHDGQLLLDQPRRLLLTFRLPTM